MKVTEYILVASRNDRGELAQKVMSLLDLGWQLYGDPTVAVSREKDNYRGYDYSVVEYAQAMVKVEN